jgi:hypothetical protein
VSRLAATALLAALSLSACATTGTNPAPKRAPFATVRPADHINDAIQLLVAGKPIPARERLVKALKKQPGNKRAQSLLQQIDTDPKLLLGAKSFSYRARSGDTASSLAQKFLHDPLMFYALARYNDLDPPSQTLDGRTVMIPGEAPAAPKPRPVKPQPTQKPAPVAKPAVAATPRDPARAAQLRSAGLVQMNQGAVDKAVALLRQASGLDPDNAAIKRDLDRALRLQRTVAQ